MNKPFDLLLINGQIATCDQNDKLINQAGIAVKNKKIAWLGEMRELTRQPHELAHQVEDLQGRCLTPGFIDCHTHLVYAGNRANEFALRLQGASYVDIAKQGGGIQATVQATRQISAEDLFTVSLTRAKALLAQGTTTIEIKSGYGLDLESELKILRVAKRIENALPISISKTFLGAHVIPPEYLNRENDYLALICNEMIPLIAKEKLADAVDVFCEKIAFNLQQTQKIFASAKQYGLGIKCHAEQLSESGSAALAAEYQAWSVDHLEYISESGIKAMAESGTTAVLLPGAFYFLKETKLPPIDILRKYKIPKAIATDCNPGTSPILSLLIILNMACVLYGFTPLEALAGVTRHAAKALNREKTHGSLMIGKIADFAIWNVENPVELVYYLGGNLLHTLVKAGKLIPIKSGDFL